MLLFLGSVLLALGFSALCSLLEACLLSFTPSQVADLARVQPRRGRIWQSFKNDIERPISVILIVNTAAHTIGATVAGSQFEHVFIKEWGWGQSSILVFSGVFTLLMLTFTEILPKTLGVQLNDRLAPVVAFPLAAATRILSPLLTLTDMLTDPFQPEESERKTSSTVREIASLASLARLSRTIGRHQERIIRRAPALSEMTLRMVMIPVEQVAFLEASETLGEALARARSTPHTRYPVREDGDPDHVVGYINIKEAALSDRIGPDAGLRSILRPIESVEPDLSPAQMLPRFLEQRVHVALVREGEATLGLVTLEDVIEELVGEVEDEFDHLPGEITDRPEGGWTVGGGAEMRALGARLAIEPDAPEESVSAWIMKRLGHTPRPGDAVEHGGWRFRILRVRRSNVAEAEVFPVAQDKT